MQTNLFGMQEKSELSGMEKSHVAHVEIKEMSLKESKNENLIINYSFQESLWGDVLMASTQKGLVYLAFSDHSKTDLSVLENRFPNAQFTQQSDQIQDNALHFLSNKNKKLETIKLYLKGTSFQHKVWKALLEIPVGQSTTYGELATKIGKPKAARAVGTAIGNNPIAYIIPCHRVVQSSGGLGGYRWGESRKVRIIEWERDGVY